MSERPIPDKRWVRASFERAASGYDAAAVLQREVGARLLERLDLLKIQPRRILDLGAGTGWCSEALARRYRKADVVALDLAHAMLQRARARFPLLKRYLGGPGFVCGDAERLSFADASFDMVFSNLTLQWCYDLPATFAELRRVLRPGGVLMFTSFGPDTLYELRASWARVDAGVHVNDFVDMHLVGDAMVEARLADPVMDMERITLTYRNALDLMHELKAIGAHNVNRSRPRGMTGRAHLRALTDAYEAFRRDGVLPATYEVVYGHAWAPEGIPQQANRPDGVHISFDQLRGSLRGR